MDISVVVTYVVGLAMGFFLGVKWIVHQERKATQSIKKKIEDIFINIKDNIQTMSFKQRIHQFAHFTIDKYTVVYIMDKKELAIFEGENCIAISNQLERSNIPIDIMKFIDDNFKKQINEEIINVNGYIVSKNFIKNMPVEKSDIDKLIESNKSKLSLDEVLDKISHTGMEGLTTEEKEFLNNYGK